MENSSSNNVVAIRSLRGGLSHTLLSWILSVEELYRRINKGYPLWLAHEVVQEVFADGHQLPGQVYHFSGAHEASGSP